ncbi:MAG: HmuY family protein [Archangiaceae bacterium]|nr:HmuY family protein [Archangiaceae bacterium]
MKRCLLMLLLAACAPDLRDDFPFDGALPAGNYLENQAEADGVTYSTIDATHKDSFVYVDLDTAGVVTVADGWELSFQRFKISANGGSSGPGTVRVALVKGEDFGSATRAPKDGYLQDGTDTVFNGIEGGWYTYDLGKHKLVTNDDRFYVIDNGEGGYWKLRMKSYYDDQGTAARMTFWWAKLLPPN